VTDRQICVPNGNWVFGFWPGKKSFFIGADGNNAQEAEMAGLQVNLSDMEPSGTLSRKTYENLGNGGRRPIIDKTWFFDPKGKVTGWIRARRVGDAADGGTMHFRVSADSRLATLGPDLKVRKMRRLAWADGSTADAVFLWEDLHLGFFIRGKHLVLARWQTPTDS
jgi:hypothetical protein